MVRIYTAVVTTLPLPLILNLSFLENKDSEVELDLAKSDSATAYTSG